VLFCECDSLEFISRVYTTQILGAFQFLYLNTVARPFAISAASHISLLESTSQIIRHISGVSVFNADITNLLSRMCSAASARVQESLIPKPQHDLSPFPSAAFSEVENLQVPLTSDLLPLGMSSDNADLFTSLDTLFVFGPNLMSDSNSNDGFFNYYKPHTVMRVEDCNKKVYIKIKINTLSSVQITVAPSWVLSRSTFLCTWSL